MHDQRKEHITHMADDLFERGMAVRRAVLGDEHVARAQANTTALDADFQRFITEVAWGRVWARPGLDQRTRHLITLAMLAALDRREELAMHVAATVRTGVTVDELKEVFLQVAVYAGVPAANAAFAVAKRVLAGSSGLTVPESVPESVPGSEPGSEPDET
jgi:4-carboxymuconolactone decarboxylase